MIEAHTDEGNHIMTINLIKDHTKGRYPQHRVGSGQRPLALNWSATAPIIWLPRGHRRLPRLELCGRDTR